MDTESSWMSKEKVDLAPPFKSSLQSDFFYQTLLMSHFFFQLQNRGFLMNSFKTFSSKKRMINGNIWIVFSTRKAQSILQSHSHTHILTQTTHLKSTQIIQHKGRILKFVFFWFNFFIQENYLFFVFLF